MCSIIIRLHVRDFVSTWTFHSEVNNGASAVPYIPCFYTIVLSLMWEGGLYLIAQLVLVIHPHKEWLHQCKWTKLIHPVCMVTAKVLFMATVFATCLISLHPRIAAGCSTSFITFTATLLWLLNNDIICYVLLQVLTVISICSDTPWWTSYSPSQTHMLSAEWIFY